MAHLTSYIENCGISELANIFSGSLKEIVAEVRGNACPFIFFSTAGARSGALARYIRRRKFGTVKYVGKRNNPGGSDGLKMWVWMPDYRAMEERI